MIRGKALLNSYKQIKKRQVHFKVKGLGGEWQRSESESEIQWKSSAARQREKWREEVRKWFLTFFGVCTAFKSAVSSCTLTLPKCEKVLQKVDVTKARVS